MKKKKRRRRSSQLHYAVLCSVAQSRPLSVGFWRQEYWSALLCPPPGDLPNPGIEPKSPALQVDPLLSEAPGKPKNTGMGRLSLLQGIFPTPESNQGLLHCRQILYQLSYLQLHIKSEMLFQLGTTVMYFYLNVFSQI